MAKLTIGILAHVDAGETTPSERTLYETGIIRAVGRVDDGTTQTDTMAIERARGITIESAVVAFQLGDLAVNLIDTPGHADFVAELERSLRVLDGVVLVVSAVEGVQPQTRRLSRAIRAAGLPMLVFVNKIDRLGARGQPVLADLRRALGLRVLPMNVPVGLGGRTAQVVPADRHDPAWRGAAIDLLAESDDGVIAAYERRGGNLDAGFVAAELRAQVARGDVVPVYFGSAVTGAGVDDLLPGIAEWLPPSLPSLEAPLAGEVFKVVRRPSGEKVVYARLFTGELSVRQRIPVRRGGAASDAARFDERITGIDRIVPGGPAPAVAAQAGDIVALHGLRRARIGDRLGDGDAGDRARSTPGTFPTPALELLAEEDPLISLRQRGADGEISLCVFGEVQKEIVAETLAQDHALTQGLFGWEVTDCAVALVEAGYWSVPSTAADFRNLTPLVLMQALARAGTAVCKPIATLDILVPEDAYGAVSAALVAARATIRNVSPERDAVRVVADIPTVELRGIERQLPGLTRGEGEWTATFAGYAPVAGDPPVRPRRGADPLDRDHYLASVAGVYGGSGLQ